MNTQFSIKNNNNNFKIITNRFVVVVVVVFVGFSFGLPKSTEFNNNL